MPNRVASPSNTPNQSAIASNVQMTAVVKNSLGHGKKETNMPDGSLKGKRRDSQLFAAEWRGLRPNATGCAGCGRGPYEVVIWGRKLGPVRPLTARDQLGAV